MCKSECSTQLTRRQIRSMHRKLIRPLTSALLVWACGTAGRPPQCALFVNGALAQLFFEGNDDDDDDDDDAEDDG